MTKLHFAAERAMAGAALISGPLRVHIEDRRAIPAGFSKKKREQALGAVIFPVTKPDCNNVSKSLDALNGVVWIDDKQIVDEHSRKRYSDRPGITIVVSSIT
jgi:Holliday junction resolvase RusA-like endonuclease